MGSKRIHERSEGGFTLIELMVVVSIIAIIAAAVVPSFSLTLMRERQRQAAVLVVQAAFEARARAARTGRCHRVDVQLGNPVTQGGNGGMVSLWEAVSRIECGNVAAGDWQVVTTKSVGGQGAQAALVGADVGIVAEQWQNPCPATNLFNHTVAGTVSMHFEPTGGLNATMIDNAVKRFFVIRADAGGGKIGVDLCVRVAASGAVKYQACDGDC